MDVTSGVAALDSLLGSGLAIGDNVVWIADHIHDTDRYCDAFLAAGTRGRVVRLPGSALPVSPAATAAARVIDVDRFPDPRELEELILSEEVGRGTRVVVSSFDDLVTHWGARAAVDFYTRTCPRLFDRGAIAYWPASRELTGPAVVEGVSKIAQCVLELRSDRLRVRKAEGRPSQIQGAVATVGGDGDDIVVDREHTSGRLGEGLRRLRARRGLTQRQLAQVASVTPAAISQAESGRRGLSLDTLVRVCESLDVGLDELMGIGRRPSPWLARHDRVVPTASGTLPLFDDPDVGARVHLVTLAPDQEGRPPLVHKGPEVVVVATGLVLVDLGSTTPVLRAGDAVMATDEVVQGWRNLADGPSSCCWIALGS